jgi:hypothetical protein
MIQTYTVAVAARCQQQMQGEEKNSGTRGHQGITSIRGNQLLEEFLETNVNVISL